jgi:hypothetical protein
MQTDSSEPQWENAAKSHEFAARLERQIRELAATAEILARDFRNADPFRTETLQPGSKVTAQRPAQGKHFVEIVPPDQGIQIDLTDKL